MLLYSRLISLLLMGVLCYVQNSPMFCCTHHITVQLMHFWHVSALSSMHCALFTLSAVLHTTVWTCAAQCAWLKKGRGGVREGVGGQSRAEHFGRKCSFLFLASTLTKKLPHLFCPKCIFLLKNSKNVACFVLLGADVTISYVNRKGGGGELCGEFSIKYIRHVSGGKQSSLVQSRHALFLLLYQVRWKFKCSTFVS